MKVFSASARLLCCFFWRCQQILLRALLLITVSLAHAHAADTPVGQWRSIDDETGKAKSIIEIVEVDGELSGKVKQLLNAGNPNALCDKCKGDKKGLPIQGLEILWGVSQQNDQWGGGKILDPKKGKIYKVRLTLIEQGTKLKVRGFIGTPALGRTQIWHRVQN